MHVLFATLHYSIILYSQAQFEENITINIKSSLKKIEVGIDFVHPSTQEYSGPSHLYHLLDYIQPHPSGTDCIICGHLNWLL